MLKKTGRVLWNDKVAAAHTVFFLIAAALFLPIVGGLFIFLKDTADSTERPSAGLRTRAVQGLYQITESSGVARSPDASSSYWEQQVGKTGWSVTEMGLRDENLSALGFNKIDNLQRGGLIQRDDPYINYPEFKKILGLGDGYDFHLRLYPLVQTGTTDPFGTGPIEGNHVAYVANVQSGTRTGAGEWSDLSVQAQREIQALKDIRLGGTAPASGFDGKAYQPIATDPIPNPALPATWVNLLEVKQGDVIGDITTTYTGPLPDKDAKPYWEWFLDDYLFKSDGTNRYDAIVFGSDADLSYWDEDKARSSYTTFLEQGGSIVFLGNEGLPLNFVNQCTAPDNGCLLSKYGSGQPVSTPDVTNQMLTVPNQLSWPYPNGANGYWDICGDERKGWIPIDIDGTKTSPCAKTWFGATSSDRYGPDGGTLILNAWDLTAIGDTELDRFLANTLSFSVMRSAFLDYGPEIPKDDFVESAERLLTLSLPSGEYVDVKMVFYLWKNDCTTEYVALPGDLC